MSNIEVTTTGNTITTKTPYTPSFPSKAKKIGGKWNPSEKAWAFDIRDEAKLHALLAEEFGWNPATSGKLTTVHITLDDDNSNKQEVRFAGRTIARRLGRDAEVQLGENVVIAEGEFPASGGSMRNPAIIEYGSRVKVTLEVRDLPVEALAAAGELEFVEVEHAGESIDREALEDEKARLLARIAEIDSLLA